LLLAARSHPETSNYVDSTVTRGVELSYAGTASSRDDEKNEFGLLNIYAKLIGINVAIYEQW
jgi:hypothetical protein